MSEFARRMKRIGKAYNDILERIPVSPSVNQRYTFDLDSTQLSMLLSNASLLVDEILGADNETGFWFWADYVNPAYQRGTAQEFANLAQQSAVYAAGQESVSAILLSEPYRRRLILVRARTFEEMKNLSADVKADMARILADIHGMDHDAILLHEVGAATPEQGVGLMVNADLAQPLKANSGALVGESYREREQRLDRAAKAKFAAGADEYAWIADFTDSQAVIIRNGGTAEVFGYKSEGGVITFDDTGTAVARQESWVAVVANKFKALFTPQEQPAPNHKTEGDMPLTKEELEQIGSMVSEAVATNTEKAIKPLAEKVDALQANQDKLTETLTANSRAEEKTKREAVAKVHGDIVANALSGEALDAMFKSLGEAAPLGTNSAQQQKETGAPNPDEYFKK
ncbi:hypothetical protein ACRRLO_003879 [Enterobacter asburiae]